MLNDMRIDATIPAVDVERARQFYRDTLGLEEITPPNLDPEMAEANAMFRVGDCSRFLLYKRPHRSKAEHTLATFTVDDLEGTMGKLRDQGVRFERYDMPGLKTDKRGIVEQDGMKAAWFKDSEGNILGIGEMPSLS
ncbi:MAG: VOC family protein [Anaerolineae bacterium]|jgi:catechol 2,3-dioxygenase-like lactoylglutathione lyase family enzyme